MGKKSQILIIFIVLIYGCQYQAKSDNKIDKENAFLNSTILISRGAMEVNLMDTSSRKANFTDEVYRFEIKKPNILVCSKGYGKKSDIAIEGINDITFNSLIKKDTVFLSDKEINKIQLLIKRIYDREEYISVNEPTDNWLVNLQIGKKKTIYYLGESIDVLNLDYLHLVDEIVRKSSIQVKDYR